MKKFDCITIGGATRDIIFKTDDFCIELENKKQCYMCFEYGRKIIPSETHFTFGGGALNSAVSMSRFGLKVSTIINIGAHESSYSLWNHLKKEKIDTHLVIKSNKKNDYRGISVILIDKGKDHAAILNRGANDRLEIKNWSFLKKTNWIYVTSLTGKSDKLLKDLLPRIKKNKVNLAWNPGSVQLKRGYRGLRELFKVTKILILNEHEARDLVCSKEDKIQCQIGPIIEEIKSWGPEVVVITEGPKGAQVAFDGEVIKVGATEARVVDTTGAGDSFGSTFVASLIKGYDPEKALKLASINSASVVSCYGAQEGLLSRSALLKKLKAKK